MCANISPMIVAHSAGSCNGARVPFAQLHFTASMLRMTWPNQSTQSHLNSRGNHNLLACNKEYDMPSSVCFTGLLLNMHSVSPAPCDMQHVHRYSTALQNNMKSGTFIELKALTPNPNRAILKNLHTGLLKCCILLQLFSAKADAPSKFYALTMWYLDNLATSTQTG